MFTNVILMEIPSPHLKFMIHENNDNFFLICYFSLKYLTVFLHFSITLQREFFQQKLIMRLKVNFFVSSKVRLKNTLMVRWVCRIVLMEIHLLFSPIHTFWKVMRNYLKILKDSCQIEAFIIPSLTSTHECQCHFMEYRECKSTSK